MLERVSSYYGQKGKETNTTINGHLQKETIRSLNNYVKHLQSNQVNNACAMVVSLKDGNVKAYVGNSSNPGTHSMYVDLIHSNRSSGSILKPFLYAAALQEGMIHPSTLLKDVPTSINGFLQLTLTRAMKGLFQQEKH